MRRTFSSPLLGRRVPHGRDAWVGTLLAGCVGDFDGDGRTDVALLMKRQRDGVVVTSSPSASESLGRLKRDRNVTSERLGAAN